MIETKAINVVLDKKLVDEAETVLKELGISPTAAIAMYYSKIAKCKKLPLDPALFHEPSEDDYTKEKLQNELEKGIADIEQGKCYTSEEVREIFKIRYGL